MNMRYAKRSEDTEQINVVSWAGWNMNRYPELKWLFHVKVIEEYLNLSDSAHRERNLNMSIPNNSILKDGKIK